MGKKESRQEHLVVVGLGYVGLPLALLAAERGYQVTGIDTDTRKIAQLRRHTSYIQDVSSAALRKTTAQFAADIQAAVGAEIIIICVPTPVTAQKDPDLRPLEGAIRAVAPLVQAGTLVVIESTINPGVCDEVLIPLLEKSTGLAANTIDLVHCPERINPGDPQWTVRTINRVIGGSTPEALRRGLTLYRRLLDAEVRPMQSLKEAEAVKVVENSFRDINIAFVNELAMAFHTLGIDVENVIAGAATKPFAFMAHHPGCGVGGHCIPVDPLYLIDYSRRQGFDQQFLRTARQINERMPAFTVQLLEDALAAQGKKLKGAQVTLLGLAYKANVGDDRESPAYVIKDLLIKKGVKLLAYDPFIPGKSDVSSLTAALDHADHLVVSVAHDSFRRLTPSSLAQHGIGTVIDGRNMWRQHGQAFARHGIAYTGIGVH